MKCIAMIRLVVLMLTALLLQIGCQCGDDDDSSSNSTPVDDSADDDAADDSAGDDTGDDTSDDSGSDDVLDDDSSDDDSEDDSGSDDTAMDDTSDDDTEYTQLEMPPADGRLYAAAANAVITPDAFNHPGPIYLGGTGNNRVATGVHDDLRASLMLLGTHDDFVAIVSLDLVGWSRTHSRRIQAELEKYGLDGNKIFISSTHTHEGPDTIGMWGPDTFTSGASPTYAAFLEQTVIDLVVNSWADLVPVTLTAGEIAVDEPASNRPGLINDYRDPNVTHPEMQVAKFDDDGGQTVGTLINWYSHPESNICTKDISADFPTPLRERVELLLGGTAVYISGAVGGLTTPLGEI
jgi:hypothetical protein